jgi:hypothetical protein
MIDFLLSSQTIIPAVCGLIGVLAGNFFTSRSAIGMNKTNADVDLGAQNNQQAIELMGMMSAQITGLHEQVNLISPLAANADKYLEYLDESLPLLSALLCAGTQEEREHAHANARSFLDRMSSRDERFRASIESGYQESSGDDSNS